jgi:hypothetical protein
MSLYTSKGVLKYSFTPAYGYRLVVDIDPEIPRLARYFVPKHIRLNPPRYAPHISVVRKEVPKDLTTWGLHHGKRIKFEYSPIVDNDHTYWWLRVFSDELCEIRTKMGLLPHGRLSRPPDDRKCFHTTIGNTKILT